MTTQIQADGLLHTRSREDQHWGTANLGEAMPGVLTPLGWSIWGPAAELGVRSTFARMGALEPRNVVVPEDTSERFISIFYGRVAGRINFLCQMGDRLPGTNAEVIAGQMLGQVPADVVAQRDLSRLPAIALKMPGTMIGVKRRVIDGAAPVGPWWRQRLATVDALDIGGARDLLREGNTQFHAMVAVQSDGFFIGVQSLYDQLQSLIQQADLPDEQANAIMAGQGSHVETEIISDLWALGRRELPLEAFLDRHGFHGPLEGEISGRVWREDPTPVLRLAEQYASRPDSAHPEHGAAQRVAERIAAERELLRRLPRRSRPGARFVLKLGVSRLPVRGVGKAAFLQSLDICRAASRRIGALLAEAGTIADPEDVFYLTMDELLDPIDFDAATVVAERRELRDALLKLNVPTQWKGNPEAVAIDAEAAQRDALTGIGASGGVVEGTVRVVHDPTFTDVEPDEVVVCSTTDPSWASVLFLSSALVVDIGGKLSHAAVVAREVGIPCVINTRDGTKHLRTGDRVRVDGNRGTVEVLQRVTPVEAADEVGSAS